MPSMNDRLAALQRSVARLRAIVTPWASISSTPGLSDEWDVAVLSISGQAR
jgi:hypothetical protein